MLIPLRLVGVVALASILLLLDPILQVSVHLAKQGCFSLVLVLAPVILVLPVNLVGLVTVLAP